MTPWLSCVVPTVGRPTLARTLDSLDAQPDADGLEVLVVADTFGGLTADLQQARDHVLEERDPRRYRWVQYDAGFHMVGHPQRTMGAQLASAPWCWFSQDDNIAAHDALPSIRRVIVEQSKPRPLFFQVQTFWRAIVWNTATLAENNIDADCLVFPQHIAQSVEWGMRYQGDFDAAHRASQLADGDVAWIDHVVAIGRPEDSHCWWKAA